MLSRLKSEERSYSIFSFLYVIIGVALLILLIQSNFTVFHVGFLGALNLIAFYGLNRRESWAIYLTAGLSSTGIVFGCSIIYAICQLPLGLMETGLLLLMALYVAFSVISLLYIVIQRYGFR